MEKNQKGEPPKESEKKPHFDYAHRSLDICAVCKNK